MDPLVTTLTVPLRFVVGVLAAAVAVVAMEPVLRRFPDGEFVPLVAAGVLTERRPPDAPERLADTIHYAAGLLGGGVYVWLTLLFEGLLGGPGLLPPLLAAVVLYAFLTGFFLLVVLPRSRVTDLRVPRLQRAWPAAAGAYVLVLATLTTLGSTLV